jgi:hypothetical protein
VVVHPGYRTLTQSLVDQAMASGEAMLIVVFLASSDDIALIELQQPMADVAPVHIHAGGSEFNRTIQIIGKGATGTGEPWARSQRSQPHRAPARV